MNTSVVVAVPALVCVNVPANVKLAKVRNHYVNLLCACMLLSWLFNVMQSRQLHQLHREPKR